MNKVFNYIRISTKEQNEVRQIQSMEEFNKNNNIVNAIELIDKATGTNTDRPNLQMLLKVVGEGDLVVIKSIDRLSRNYKEVMELWNEITLKGADIVVIDMPLLDTRQHKDLLGDFISNLILQVLSYVAQQETDFRKQRQAEGIAIAKSEGRHLGRPKAEYPYNFEQEYKNWKQGNQTAKVTMESLGLKRTTFYKLVKKYEEDEQQDFTNNTNI
ncbi:recombinase family protein [[Clostridium] dakarense]|uniref:recombinase family protein n=1 Tax=Faecalimicrobium dakarense TaxID=1301100 RepID=UPI0004B2B321|nr:recombinase family protein [[Clostridium] dakarense]